jgi:hypothetical protein
LYLASDSFCDRVKPAQPEPIIATDFFDMV